MFSRNPCSLFALERAGVLLGASFSNHNLIYVRSFNVPDQYQSPIIATVKEARKVMDPRKRDLAPSILDFGPVQFKIARHFGFCYGVEHAIEVAYQALDDHPDRRIYLLSEMIHNPRVNDDLRQRGIQFLRTTSGEQLIPFDMIQPEDIVIVPAFGTSRETWQALEERGIDPKTYDATCPFVVKVWRRSAQIGQKDYTVVVHGKRYHEETRATFSHAQAHAPVVVVRDLDEAADLARVVKGEASAEFFFERFANRYTEGFDPVKDLHRIGVVNQTTMLASETKAIADLLRQAMVERYGIEQIQTHFADTSDTLCYATNENQTATQALVDSGGDIAIVVGGYNSSNTSHLVELCEAVLPTYFIAGSHELISEDQIQHFDFHHGTLNRTSNWLPLSTMGKPLEIILTSGASCPDALLDEVIRKIVNWYPDTRPLDEVLAPFVATQH